MSLRWSGPLLKGQRGAEGQIQSQAASEHQMKDPGETEQLNNEPKSGASGRNIRMTNSNTMSRMTTVEDDETVETRPIGHRYVFRRPRALQYSYKSLVITAEDEAGALTPIAPRELTGVETENTEGRPGRIFYSAEGVSKHRERLDLFTDLIWVGIISNLADVFSQLFFVNEHGAGEATLIFILVFLPSWRIWNFLREFMNNYYMDDIAQRVFIFWILVLSVFFGNNLAYLPEDFNHVKTILVSIYLLIRGSFVLMEIVYSFWIPWLRRIILFHFLAAVPATALWLAVIFVDDVAAVGPAVAAVFWEYLVPLLLESPLAEKFVPSEYRKQPNPEHLRTRMANFFIITVGEGVLMLIKDGPLKVGVTSTAILSVWSLLIYFLLSYLYFNHDQGVRYIPAVRAKGWRMMIWIFWHIPLFASFITLSASMLFVITQDPSHPLDAAKNEIPADELKAYGYDAIWKLATSLAIIVFSMTVQALLDKPLDPPGTLLVDNRYIRLAGRVVYVIVITTVPIKKDIDLHVFLGIAAIGLSLTMAWEWIVSLERPAKVFEPRGLTVLMKRELSGARQAPRERGGLFAS